MSKYLCRNKEKNIFNKEEMRIPCYLALETSKGFFYRDKN